MNIKAIRNDADLQEVLKQLEPVFQAEAGTPEHDEMETLVSLIEGYENKHFPTGPADLTVRVRGREQVIGPVEHTWDEFFLNGPTVSEDFKDDRI
jgi:HTH-type transcriptional regulator/antitoxin HigA